MYNHKIGITTHMLSIIESEYKYLQQLEKRLENGEIKEEEIIIDKDEEKQQQDIQVKQKIEKIEQQEKEIKQLLEDSLNKHEGEKKSEEKPKTKPKVIKLL